MNDAQSQAATTLNALRDICYQTSKDHGFHDGPGKTVGDDLMLMVSELAEALEDFRKHHDPDEYWYETKDGVVVQPAPDAPISDVSSLKPCGVPSEIADTIVRALDFCGKYKIDIGRAVVEKMAFNKSRPYRHGNKKI